MTDLEIAQKVTPKPIHEIASQLGIDHQLVEPYGRFKAKLPLDLIDEKKASKSKLILVTAMTPTPAGEGKTTVSIGLNEGLVKIGKKSIAVLREPSLGPVFGIKGGATGGGWSQVIPMEDINLHFTGDFAAIEKANNLLSALIDNNIQSKTRNLGIDPRTVVWKRVIDMNDRSLRHVVAGLGGTSDGVPRETGFNITAASEVMAILCLCTDLEDLKRRLGNIFVGFTYDKKPIYARDLKAEGAMAILLKEAIKPNLVQTLEGNPAIIHGGPFGNIAQGTNSIIGTKMGLSLADYVVTEAGFGADLGAEKFLDIKCGYGNLKPDAVVVVATLRALRYQGGASLSEISKPNLEAVKKGFSNLERHIQNMQKFGFKPVVVINQFVNDSEEEINWLKQACQELGGSKAVVSDGWTNGGNGCIDLAQAVADAIEEPSDFKPLYDWNTPVKEKIWTIASEIYGAGEVQYSSKAQRDLKSIEQIGLSNLPICMAKTQKSFSENPNELGAPTGFELNVREFEIAAGAGFLIPIIGKMMRMPGLPEVPASEGMDIDKNGVITGLS
ncbi:MAG: formate--tetrahydrofolate ligase [Flavobacteriales bacterium]|nr:formate--tetrahydrofolate ligase [Flavobacteriales bacterium]MCB9203687.1 formate--tetrahydrofolate ligase [Flavobacteriales bacterium]